VGKLTKNHDTVLTQDYNIEHIGIDVTANDGEKNILDWIIPIAKGKVIEIVSNKNYTNNDPSNYGDYGNYIIIDHSNGVLSRYAHLAYNTIKVKLNEVVDESTILAFMGATGYAFGGHLHFEIIVNGNTIDPYDYVFKDKLLIIAENEKPVPDIDEPDNNTKKSCLTIIQDFIQKIIDIAFRRKRWFIIFFVNI